MTFKELYPPKSGRMRVAGLMSGSGSNLIKIIEQGRRLEAEEGRALYEVVVIFSDNLQSNAGKIGEDYEIPVVVRDLGAFYKERGKPRRDLTVRVEFDEGTVEALKPFNVDVAAYAGYMSIATAPLINAFLGVNVHPADLSVMNGDRRKYTGDHAVRDALLAGEKELRVSTHLIEPQVDDGRILMISSPLMVNLPKGLDINNKHPENKKQLDLVSNRHQNRLKEIGDWIIFPRTLEYLAGGRYSQDGQGNLYFDNKPIPQGVRLET